MKKTLFSIACIGAFLLNSCEDEPDNDVVVRPDCYEWPSNITGNYTGRTTCGNDEVFETISIISGLNDCEVIVDDLVATMITANSFTIADQATIVDGEAANVSGSGTVSGDNISISMVVNGTGFSRNCTFISADCPTCTHATCINNNCVPWRSEAVGNYTGTTACDGQAPVNETIYVSVGTGTSGIVLDGMNGNMVSQSNFTIPNQSYFVQGLPNANVSGSGSIGNGSIYIEFSITAPGGSTSCSFSGN